MALRTRLTEQLGIRHPVLLAPMGFVSGGALAAAVNATPRGRRSNRRQPISASSALIRAVMLDWTVFSSTAARFMPPSRATASKTFRSAMSMALHLKN